MDYLGGTHILKPPTDEYPHMPEVENLTMHLADLCKIRTAPHGLIPMADGKLAYITKRFDRVSGKKIAVEDLCQLSGVLTEQKYRGTAERVGKVVRQLSSNPGDDALRYFELTVFSFLSGNADMHMKNFSMVTDKPSYVHLSPSYDLLATRLFIPEKDDTDELALPIQGKKSSLKRVNFLALGEYLKIPMRSVERSLQNFLENEETFIQAIEGCILTDDLKGQYKELLQSRMKRL